MQQAGVASYMVAPWALEAKSVSLVLEVDQAPGGMEGGSGIRIIYTFV